MADGLNPDFLMYAMQYNYSLHTHGHVIDNQIHHQTNINFIILQVVKQNTFHAIFNFLY